MGVSKELFGKTKEGQEIYKYWLSNSKGMKAGIINYGAILVNLFVPDKEGNTEDIVFENGGFVGNLGLSKKLWKKYIEASYKYRTNTDKITASDYTHLFGYLNPYYRSAYNVSKRRK